jgi:CRP-like cAMP-binding protein
LDPRRAISWADIAVLAPDATSKLQKLHFEAGDVVIRQGDQGETAYIIQSGRVEILKGNKKVGELGTGDFFGEIALVSDVKRTATVRCLSACELTVLSRDDFQALSVGSSTWRVPSSNRSRNGPGASY